MSPVLRNLLLRETHNILSITKHPLLSLLSKLTNQRSSRHKSTSICSTCLVTMSENPNPNLRPLAPKPPTTSGQYVQGSNATGPTSGPTSNAPSNFAPAPVPVIDSDHRRPPAVPGHRHNAQAATADREARPVIPGHRQYARVDSPDRAAYAPAPPALPGNQDPVHGGRSFPAVGSSSGPPPGRAVDFAYPHPHGSSQAPIMVSSSRSQSPTTSDTRPTKRRTRMTDHPRDSSADSSLSDRRPAPSQENVYSASLSPYAALLVAAEAPMAVDPGGWPGNSNQNPMSHHSRDTSVHSSSDVGESVEVKNQVRPTWTEEDDETLITLREEEWEWEDIAKKMSRPGRQRTTGSCNQHFLRLREQDKTGRIKSIPKQKPWTNDESSRLEALCDPREKSWGEISKEFPGRSREAVSRYFTRAIEPRLQAKQLPGPSSSGQS